MQPKGEAQSNYQDSLEAQKSLCSIENYIAYHNKYAKKYCNFNLEGLCLDCIKKVGIQCTCVRIQEERKNCLYCKEYKIVSEAVSVPMN